MRLALELGYANVDVMLAEMPAQMFSEWLAYYQIEPFGILAYDALSAQGKAIYVNSNRRKGKLPKKIKDFLLFKERERPASDIFEAEDDDPEGGLNA